MPIGDPTKKIDLYIKEVKDLHAQENFYRLKLFLEEFALVNASITNIISGGGGVSSLSEYFEDSPHTSGDKGTFILGVRQDANSSLVDTDLDYAPFQLDADGNLKVAIISGSGSGTEYTEGDTDATITGTAIMWEDAGDTLRSVSAATPLPVNIQNSSLAVTQSGTWNINDITGTISLPTGAATEATLSSIDTALAGTLTVDTELPAAAALSDNFSNPTAPAVGAFGMLWDGGTWDRMPGTVTDGVLVNLGSNNDVTISGTVAVTQSGTWNLNDITGTISLPTGAATEATLSSIDSALAGTLTVDTELPAAAALADDTANPTVPGVGAFGMMFDGTTWDRVRGTSADGLLVNLGANNDVTVSGTVAVTQSGTWNINDITGTISLPTGAATEATLASILAGQLGDGHNVTIDNASLPVTQSGSWTVATNAEYAEDSAHSSGHTGNFILAVRSDADTTLVDTDGDYAPFQVTSEGYLKVAVKQTSTTLNEPTDGDAIDTTTTGRLMVGGTGIPGTARVLRTDNDGHLQMDVLSSALPTGAATEATLLNIDTDTGSISSLLDNAIKTPNDTMVSGIGLIAEYDDVSTGTPGENESHFLRITQQRGLHTNLRDASGSELGTSGSPLRVDPTGTTGQPVLGEVAVGAAISGTNPVVMAIQDTSGNAFVPEGISAGGVNVMAILPLDLAGNIVDYTATGEQYSLTHSTTGSKANANYALLDSNQNTRTVGADDHDAAVAGAPVLQGGYADDTDDGPTAVTADGRAVRAWFSRKGQNHSLNHSFRADVETLTALETTYDGTTTSANSADIDSLGFRSVTYIIGIESNGTPTRIQLYHQAKDDAGNYADPDFGFASNFIYEDSEIASVVHRWVTLPIPHCDQFRLRVVATGTDNGGNEFVVSVAEAYRGT